MQKRASFLFYKRRIIVDVWVQLLTDVGFPIFVTFYLLHRIEGQLALLIEAIHRLPERLKATK